MSDPEENEEFPTRLPWDADRVHPEEPEEPVFEDPFRPEEAEEE